MLLISHLTENAYNFKVTSVPIDAEAFYKYDSGPVPIVYSGFHCSGNESRLVDCPVQQNVTDCDQNRIVGVEKPKLFAALLDTNLNY